MSKLTLNTATDIKRTRKDDLIEYLRDEHGIDASEMDLETAQKKVAAVEGIDLTPKAGAPEAKKTGHSIDQQQQGEKRFEIQIHKSANKHEVDPVPVGVNGKMYAIKRGERVVVPAGVVNVLTDAVETQYEQERGSGELMSRDSQSYPFSVLREVTA